MAEQKESNVVDHFGGHVWELTEHKTFSGGDDLARCAACGQMRPSILVTMDTRCTATRLPSRFMAALMAEQDRQRRLFPGQDAVNTDLFWLGVAAEELGEVAKAVIDGGNLDEEMVQVAAVMASWFEARERRG